MASNEATQVASAAPANPEAIRFYAEGLARLHVYDALGARDLLEKAIAADPNHALSHAGLAETWSQLGYDEKAGEEAKKAFDLSANLPREQRLWMEGHCREFARDFPAAIEIYRTLRNFFPDNLDYALRPGVFTEEGWACQGRAGHDWADACIAQTRQRRCSHRSRGGGRAKRIRQFQGFSRGGREGGRESEDTRLAQASGEGDHRRKGSHGTDLGDLDKASKEALEARDLADFGKSLRICVCYSFSGKCAVRQR